MVDDVNSTLVPTLQSRDALHESEIEPIPSSQRGLTFWMVFISTLLVDMLSAIDLVRPHSLLSGPKNLHLSLFRS